MRKTMMFALYGLCLVPFIWGQQTEAPRGNSRRIFEIAGTGVINGYRSDSGGDFQLGAPVLNFETTGLLGFDRAGHAYAGIEAGLIHENVAVQNVPAAVLAAGKAYPPGIFNQTSLRQQYDWGASVGIFASRYLKFTANFDRNSWRNDYLGYGAGTIIPYYKGIQRSETFHVNFSTDRSRFRAIFDAGGGFATVDYLQGTESYLSDGDGAKVSSVSGFTIPVSASIGYNVIDDPGLKLAPVVRFSYGYSALDQRMNVNRYLLSFGLLFSTR